MMTMEVEVEVLLTTGAKLSAVAPSVQIAFSPLTIRVVLTMVAPSPMPVITNYGVPCELIAVEITLEDKVYGDTALIIVPMIQEEIPSQLRQRQRRRRQQQRTMEGH